MIHWALENDEKARKIATNGRNFVEEFLVIKLVIYKIVQFKFVFKDIRKRRMLLERTAGSNTKIDSIRFAA